jgi:hypothetical protein
MDFAFNSAGVKGLGESRWSASAQRSPKPCITLPDVGCAICRSGWSIFFERLHGQSGDQR